MRAASPARRIISSAMACRASARANAGIARHALKPASAASRAACVSATPATGASPSEASVTGLITGAVAPFAAGRHSPAMKSPNGLYMSANLRKLHRAAFRNRFERGLRERERTPPIFEADDRRPPGFDSVDEFVDLSVESLAIALDEKVQQRRRAIAETVAGLQHVMRPAVVGDRHALGAERFDALVVAVQSLTRIEDDGLLARRCRHHDRASVVIA